MAQLESLKGTALGEVLARHREGLNELFRRAAAVHRRLDPEDLKLHLVRRLAPVVAAVAAAQPDRGEAVTMTLYERSLELLGRGFMTEVSRCPAMDRVWEELLPAIAIPLASQPNRVTVAFTNAAFHLTGEPGVQPEVWLEWMKELAPRATDVKELLALGQVLAWRAGMAHFRDSALAKWESLGEALKLESLGFGGGADEEPPSLTELRRRLGSPWHRATEVAPLARGELAARVGGFRGFGGRFLEPPEVRAKGERLFVLDGGDPARCYRLHADCYGAVLKRLGSSSTPKRATELPDGALSEQASVSPRGFPNPASLASTSSTIALTQRRSHHVFLFPLA